MRTEDDASSPRQRATAVATAPRCRLRIDAAFVDLGLAPNSACVRQLARIDGCGFIWVDERMATTVPGLFAAGDVTTAFGEQILIAVGDGARAALSAYDYILARSPAPELAAAIAHPATIA